MKSFLYKGNLLPDGFEFPANYEKLAEEGGWPDIEPWYFLALDMPTSLSYYGNMLLKFPESPLIPFAKINDESGLYNDGFVVVACFDGSDQNGQPKVRIYDYGRPTKSPWDNLSYPNFDAWLEAAKNESSRYKIEKNELDEE